MKIPNTLHASTHPFDNILVTIVATIHNYYDVSHEEFSLSQCHLCNILVTIATIHNYYDVSHEELLLSQCHL
jgi:hypothetical protein